jgi:flagellar biosynthesis chaperone FliJ
VVQNLPKTFFPKFWQGRTRTGKMELRNMAAKKSSTAVSSIRTDIKEALQGLAHWVSYKQILYKGHSLNEGALVAEFVNLLNAKLGKDFEILCESAYRPFNKTRGPLMDVDIKQKNQRVAAIEFKRILAGTNSINSDIKKLAKNIKSSEILRFLVVVSEKELPKKYVNENGDKNLCHEDGFSAEIIGIFESNNFNGKNKNLPVANYCCLIEISKST